MSGEKDGAWIADSKIAAGVDDLNNTHPLNCTEDGTLKVDISSISGGPIDVIVDNIVPVSQSGTWTVNLANEPTIDIGKVDQGDPNTLAEAWPVEITDGTNVLGTSAHPLEVTGSITGSPNVNIHDSAGNTLNSTSGSLDTLDINITNGNQRTQIIDSSLNSVQTFNDDFGNYSLGVAVEGQVQPTLPTFYPNGSFVPISLNPDASVNVTIKNVVTELDCNLNAVNGAVISLGQTVMGNSIPVVLPSNQSAIPVTLTSTTITGNVTVVQPTGSNLHTDIDNFPAAQAVTQSTSPWIISGTVTTTPPANASTNITEIGGSPLSEGQKVMASSIPVVIASDQSTIPVSGTITTSPNVNVHDGSGTAINSTSNALNVQVENSSLAVTGTFWQTTQPVSVAGTVAVTGTFWQTTQPVSLTSTTITGNVTVVQPTGTNLHVVVDGTSPISGTVTANQGTANTLANAWPVELSDGTNLLGTSSHPLRIDPTGTTTQPISGSVSVSNFPATQSVSGTVAVTQSTSPWVISGTVTTTPPANASTNLTQLNNVALGSPSNYGTSPGAVEVQGVNAYITNTPAVTLTSTTITGTVAVTESGTWTVQPGNIANTTPWLVSQAPMTTGGISTHVEQALTASAQVKSSAGLKYGYEVFNPNSVTVYVFFYNTTSAPTIGSTTNLITQMGIPAGSGAVFNHTIGITFSTGIYVAVSTSATSAAAPSTGLVITTLYN